MRNFVLIAYLSFLTEWLISCQHVLEKQLKLIRDNLSEDGLTKVARIPNIFFKKILKIMKFFIFFLCLF